jgi:hypothetical protein
MFGPKLGLQLIRKLFFSLKESRLYLKKLHPNLLLYNLFSIRGLFHSYRNPGYCNGHYDT